MCQDPEICCQSRKQLGRQRLCPTTQGAEFTQVPLAKNGTVGGYQ